MKIPKKIHMARCYYPVKTLGPGNRLAIWFTGCPHHCEDCISPELKDLEYGQLVDIDMILALMEQQNMQPDGITISGGEPFFQAEGLAALLAELHKKTEDILVFTGYTYENLKTSEDPAVGEALRHIKYLVDGPYIPSLNDGRGIRGSANQRILYLREGVICEGEEEQALCQELSECTRKLQNVFYGESILEIGIPKGVEDL